MVASSESPELAAGNTKTRNVNEYNIYSSLTKRDHRQHIYKFNKAP